MKQAWLVVALVAAGCGSVPENEVICGDGQLEPGEQCDDGNDASGDGCSQSCTTETKCGNGTIDVGEQCDDANALSGDGCSATCQREATCGNSLVEVGEECDDGDMQSRDGCSSMCQTEQQYTYSVGWSFRTINNVVQGCPGTYGTIVVYSQPIDANGANEGQPILDIYDCADGSGTIAPVYEGRYKVWLESTNANGTMKYATSTSAILDLDMNGLTFTTIIYTDAGYFQFAWNLRGASSNNMLTCAQAGGDSIDMTSTLSGSSQAYSDLFDCVDGTGITAGIPAGTYTVSISALNGSDQSIGTAPALTNRQIMAPNKVTDLGTITVPIEGL